MGASASSAFGTRAKHVERVDPFLQHTSPIQSLLSSRYESRSATTTKTRKRTYLLPGEGGKAKRPRTATDAEDQELSLPPEVWAIAMGFLPYADVLRTSAVSRSMLCDVMPRVEELNILNTRELHVAPAYRFWNVRSVFVACLLSSDGTEINKDAAARIVPFLHCRQFPWLEEVVLGAFRWDEDAGGPVLVFYDPEVCESSGHKRVMKGLIKAFSAAFRSGTLSMRVYVNGLRCPRSGDGHLCHMCIEACVSFPIQQVVCFESQGLSHRRRSSCCLDVCLPVKDVMDIAKRRHGGKELIGSSERFLRILGEETYCKNTRVDGKTIGVVEYDDNEADALMSCIECGVDPTTFQHDDIICAIRSRIGSKGDDWDILPEEQCHLSESSFVLLRRLGILVKRSDFTIVADEELDDSESDDSELDD